MGLRFYVGENCHAHAVVDGGDERPELVSAAMQHVEEHGLAVFPESLLGHFSVRGAEYGKPGHPRLSADELLTLSVLGDLMLQEQPIAA